MTDFQDILRKNILDNPEFVRATFSGRQRGHTLRWERLTIRPVEVKNQRHLQFSFFDARKDFSANYRGEQAQQKLEEALALPFRNFHVFTVDENIQINLSKKGKPHLSRKKVPRREVTLAHDRSKATILRPGEDIPFLRALGVMRQDGRIRAEQRSKFQQINAFLKLLAEVDEIAALPEPVRMVDFGCGKAYLAFAAYHYLHNRLGKAVHITGVDRQAELIQWNRRIAQQLGWSDLVFERGQIADYRSESAPQIVVALHACDTASDDAIAQGVLWESEVILVAPCCHHDLQVKLKQADAPQVFAPLRQYGLLQERLGDVITDSFRALLLRLMGYSVQVIEFVSSDHSPKNLLLRAVLRAPPGRRQHVDEYLALKDFWQVDPYLAQLLDERVQAVLRR